MRLVVQRVSRAQVLVDERIVGKIGKGLLVFVGFCQGDAIQKADALARKLVNLRIFSDQTGKMNLSLLDVKGEVSIISQFTLYADLSGRRPSFTESAKPEKANELYEYFKYQVETLIKKENPSFKNIESGVFGAHMRVELENDGPVTICLEK